jgi:hypothetical protein
MTSQSHLPKEANYKVLLVNKNIETKNDKEE